MSKETGVQPQLPQFDTEFSVNLQTRETKLRRRRATGKYPEARRKAAMSSWQINLPETLALAAGSWHAARTAQQAEDLGINVEYAGSQMTAAEAEDALVAKFKQARGLHLPTLDIVSALYWKIATMRDRLGDQGDWLPAFFNYTLDQLARVYGLSQQTTINLKAFALQHHLAGFTRSISE